MCFREMVVVYLAGREAGQSACFEAAHPAQRWTAVYVYADFDVAAALVTQCHHGTVLICGAPMGSLPNLAHVKRIQHSSAAT
jgi:hypothetical protein